MSVCTAPTEPDGRVGLPARATCASPLVPRKDLKVGLHKYWPASTLLSCFFFDTSHSHSSSTHPTHTCFLHPHNTPSSTSTQHTHTLPQQTLQSINAQQHVRTWFVSQVLPLLSDPPSFFAGLLTWSQHLVEV